MFRVLTTLSIFGLSLIAPQAADAQVIPPNAPCNNIDVTGTIVTCTGDVHQGVATSGPPYTTLIVNDLTQPITPSSGVPGISFFYNGGADITTYVDTTGTTGISTDNVGIAVTDSVDVFGSGAATTGGITVTNLGSISTSSDYAHGIRVQDFASNYGGGASKTGDLLITNYGPISTDGYNAFGIQADDQAYGSSATTGALTVNNSGTISSTGFNAPPILAGTRASAYGTGPATTGALTINNSGTISTTGLISYGIAAVDVAYAYGTGSATTGALTIKNYGPISTTGDGSSAINGYDVATNYGGTAATTGDLLINNYGRISTTGNYFQGNYANGISAISQAINSNGAASATAGNVTVNSTGNITTMGGGAVGIYGQSTASGAGALTNGNITISILGGTVTGGSGSGAGVQFVDGANNSLANYGTLTALSGVAIFGGLGNETINNFGTVTGNVDLGTGTNAFNNRIGGLFNSGATVNLSGGTLTNNGTLSPGGAGVVQTTMLTGNLGQSANGTLAVDVNLGASTADKIDAGTGTATLAGAVLVTPMNLALGAKTVTIVSATGGVTDNGLALGPLSPALQAQLLTYATHVDLGIALDFAASGLNPNQTAIGHNLDAIVAAGGGGLGGVFNGLLNTYGLGAYQNALDQLSPELFNYALIETLYGSQQFSNDMLSCRVAGEDGAAFIREGQCVWARGRARFLDLDHTSDNIGASDTTGSFSAGAQLALAPDWRLGFAAGYDRINLESGAAVSTGDRANIGGIIKYNPGPLLLAAGVTGGWGSYDTTRVMSFGGFNATATSRNNIDYVSGQLHAAYLLSNGGWYAKPLVDAGVTELYLAGFTESGGGGAGLTVPSRTDTVFNVSPALEIGTEMRFDDVSVWRPFIRGGATWQSTDNFVLDAGFFDAPQGVSPFAINTKIDQVLADVSAGVDIISATGAVMRVQYDGRFAQDTQQNSVSLKGSVPF